MKNRTITTMLVAATALLALADAASAYYSPRLGRFLSRDPIAEPGAALVRQAARPATNFIPRDPIDENTYVAMQNNAISWFDPDGGQATTQLAPAPTTGNTCVVEMRCGAAKGIPGPFKHCEYDIVSSVGGTGTCGCGPAGCSHTGFYSKWCDCLNVCTNCYFLGGSPAGYGTVNQTRTLPESACECLRKKCGSYPATQCYKVAGPNSNTAANCLNKKCDLGFNDPGSAPGWGYKGFGIFGKNWEACPPNL